MNAGGITSYVMTLARGLLKHGDRVTIACNAGEFDPAKELPGAGRLPLNLRFKFELHPFLLAQLWPLCSYIQREKVDIIHAQTRATSMLAWLASFITGCPYVTTCHGYFRPHWGRRLLPLWGDRVIAISRPVRRHLLDDLHVRSGDIVLIPNGVDTELYRPPSSGERQESRRHYGLGPEPVVGIIARLSDVKGHIFLIEAMATVKKTFADVKCLIFGEGSMESELKELVLSRGLAATVFFHPVVNRTAEILRALDVFAMPSLSEGLGLSVMEAQACGLPVAASAVGGLCDIIRDQETGVLVPPRDPQALAGAIIKILSDPLKAQAMGRRARAFMEREYSVPRMVDDTACVYADVLAGKSRVGLESGAV